MLLKLMRPTRSHRRVQNNWLVTVTPPPVSGFNCVSEVLLNSEQFQKYRQWLQKGGRIQDLLPELSRAQREQLISGVTPEEWDRAFGNDD
jgi:hypothetical protein